MPAMTIGQSWVRPSSRRIWWIRYATSYPTPRVPYEPRCDRSFRTFAEFTPAASASASDDTVVAPDSVMSTSARR